MKEKKLKFSLRVSGVLEKAVSCPLGTYYVCAEEKMYFFEPVEGIEEDTATRAATLMAALACQADTKAAKFVAAIYEKCDAIKKEYLKKDGDNYILDAKLDGELEALVESKYGILYGNGDEKLFFFDTPHTGFLRQIELEKFVEGIHNDIESDDDERQLGAEIVEEILKNWAELDPEDIER